MSELINRQSLLKKQRIIIDDDGNMYKAVLVVDIENARQYNYLCLKIDVKREMYPKQWTIYYHR